MGVDVDRKLQSIHTNFVHLTHRIPMAQVEDLPEAMQRQGGWSTTGMGLIISMAS